MQGLQQLQQLFGLCLRACAAHMVWDETLP